VWLRRCASGSLWAVTTDDGPLSLDVPMDLEAVEGIRSEVVAVAHSWGFDALDDLEVVVSELVTNAIVHAQSRSTVELSLVGPGCVEVRVADNDPAPPVKRIPYEQHTRGLGLHIVDALCEQWGVREVDGRGKTVWARLGPGAEV
jgi:anti-sigma regulatory factor (Ser/Thr protein kinase)